MAAEDAPRPGVPDVADPQPETPFTEDIETGTANDPPAGTTGDEPTTVTVDGQPVSMPPGSTVLDAVEAVDPADDVQALCSYGREDLIGPRATCRTCMVETDAHGLVAACSFPAEDGLSVTTDAPDAQDARDVSLDLVLSNHNLRCSTCGQNGRCELQDTSIEANVDHPRYGVFDDRDEYVPIDDSSSVIQLDRNKCILCNRCVEACNDVQVAGVLRMEDSGNETHIGFQKSGAETWDESTCISCGHCVTVCPTGSLVEKRGTFTNTERRIQLVNPILSPPGGARTDMDILQDLAGRMGFEWDYDGPADVMEEISDLTPIYGGVTHERLEARGDGLQWPVWDEDHPGTPYLYDEAFNTDDGKAHFVPADFGEPPQLPSEEFPLTLTTGRVLYHWHTGSMTRRVEALMDQVGESFVEIHPETAAQLGVSDDEYVRVSSENGSIVVKANVTDRVDRRTVFIPMHFVHGAVNRLTMDELDPTSFIPDYKVTSVAVAPLGPDPDAEPLPAPTPGDD